MHVWYMLFLENTPYWIFADVTAFQEEGEDGRLSNFNMPSVRDHNEILIL